MSFSVRALLKKVTEQGFVTSRRERDRSASVVAAPLRGIGARVLGSTSIYGPSQRFTADRVRRFGEIVKDAAALVSLQLGYVSR